jgi:hypothetical protein
MAAPDIDMNKVQMLVEIRGLYDGWSYAIMKDGTAVNRWPVGDRRWKTAQEQVERHNATFAPTPKEN